MSEAAALDEVQASRTSADALVTLTSITKDFGGVRALADIDLTIRPGTIHALVGQNGAGKSTLGKVIGGMIRPDAGELHVDARPVQLRDPRDALAKGITCIAQELALVPTRTAIENVFLGFESTTGGVFVNRPETRRRWAAIVEQTGFTVDPAAMVGQLRLADQQKVEILRALARQARLIVLDEPTAGLSMHDTELLLDVLRRLRASGTTIVYVSHFLKEVLSVADDVTILKDGRLVATLPAAECDEHRLVSLMLGRALEQAYPTRHPCPPSTRSPALDVERLSSRSGLHEVSFAVRPGEILGIAGLAGSGRSELLHAIYGADRATGEIRIAGRTVAMRSPRRAVANGVALIPESRRDQGLMLDRSVEENLALGAASRLAVRPRFRRTNGKTPGELVDRLGIKTTGLTAPARTLSGGNQQKLLFGRCLLQSPRVLLVDEPTRGVDVGAKFSIYELLVQLADEGMAIVMVSSEMEEVLALSHRVAVMRSGRIATVLEGEAINEENVTFAAFGMQS